MYLLLMLALPVLVVGCLVISLKIVLWQRITNSVVALLWGMGAVPFVVGVGMSFALYLAHPSAPKLSMMGGVVGIVGGMIGGWIGASVAYLSNQKKSSQPEAQRAYQQAIAQAEKQPRRRTVTARLQGVGLSSTRSNRGFYTLGSFFVVFCFIGVMCKMISLGYTTSTELNHIPILFRFLGCVVPFVGPFSVYILVRRRLPALAFGLRDGFIPLIIAYLPVYAVLNMLASPPAK